MLSSPDAGPGRSGSQPSFLITIDTEGDNLWDSPREITTHNARFLPRFQVLCEKYRLKPTYLTDFQMASCPQFQEFASDALQRGTAEIGMHLHAWNSPPLVPLGADDDFTRHSYLVDYPTSAMRDKIAAQTDLLEETFGTKMVSHRAGKWAFNETYARLLVECGYLVDCSVTPHVSWQRNGGSDYTHFPETAYWMDVNDISRPLPPGATENATLLELPMTILPAARGPVVQSLHRWSGHGPRAVRLLVNRVAPAVTWLRPNGHNLHQMLRVLGEAGRQGRGYVEFMLHSSEFMPGGSPVFPSPRAIEILYDHLEQLFAAATRTYRGATLHEYYRAVIAATEPMAMPIASR